jgi:hypothetical protein
MSNLTAYDTVVGNLPYGKITDMTLGELKQLGKEVIAKTKGRSDLGLPEDEGSSAMGRYQIINPTREELARARFGGNWQNVKYTPEVQEQLAADLYNQNKGNYSKIAGRWEGAKQSKALQDNPNMPWEQARLEIGKYETGDGEYITGGNYSSLPTEKGLAATKVVVADNTPYIKPDYSNEREELEAERAAQLANRTNILGAGSEERIPRLSDIDENGLIGRYAMSDIFKPLNSLQPIVVSMPGKKATTKRRLSFSTSV